MVVRIRINLGAIRIERSTGTTPWAARIRRWLNPISGVAFALAAWQLAYDLNWTGGFALSYGLFSHWQFWMALALVLQVLETRLSRPGHGGAATP